MSSSNPYRTPADAPPAPPKRPSLMVWLLSCSAAGAALGLLADLLHWAPPLSKLPSPGGGLIVGGLIGALVGRMAGRLMIASHSFRMAAIRRAELRDEVSQLRAKRDKDADSRS